MNEPVRINLLGELQVKQGERVITRFKSQKIGALLAYLAFHLHSMHSREVIIDLFWPESALEAGRNSLSVALSTLRNQLEPPGTPANAVLRADRFSIGLNPDIVTTDVAQFQALIKATPCAGNATEQIQCLIDAVELYKGRLLPSFYETWITTAQQQMAGLFLDAISTLIDQLEQRGDIATALQYARRSVVFDPLQAQAHQRLIRILAATGQPGAALQQYKAMERLLEEEMGEEPSASLRALARQIEKQLGLTALVTLPVASRFSSLQAPFSLSTGSSAETVTLTLLMTDIEDSIRLREQNGTAFPQALESHHALLRNAFAQYGGKEIAETGDSFVVAFRSAGQALDCAVAGQQGLQEHAWPEETGPLKVRMVLHTGDVDYREGAYHGMTLHRASRMLTTGHGGQILCSEATANLVRGDLGEGKRLTDLGVWRLREAPAPERLFQVERPGMPEHGFPPLSAESGIASRLPLRFTRFFGRVDEISRLVARLRPGPLFPTSGARLVTLTGAGGAGKTRLAIEVAERLLEPFQGAVWFAPLADITDYRLIVDKILESLRIERSSYQEPLEQVMEALSKQPSLLVLDNFEQLVEGGATLVQTLLTRLPTLTVLVTSRQLLGLTGEAEFVVPPLVTPNGVETLEKLSLYDSVQLFVDRAQTAMPHFQITSGNAAAVAELCHRLEGMPLAIELAAARALVLTPGQMLKQLDHRFGFLVSRKRDTAQRHRTLQAAIDWSYQLLTPELQRFFTRLSVFRGGWTVEAAEAVCEEPLALDYLAQLRECSLVLVDEEGSEEMRFRLLESLREYAEEQISSVEKSHLQQRHANHFFTGALVRNADNHAHHSYENAISSFYYTQKRRMLLDRENYFAALRWWQIADSQREVEMIVAMVECGVYSCHTQDATHIIQRLGTQELPAPSQSQARLYFNFGMFARYRGLPVNRKLLESAVKLAEGCADNTILAYALNALGENAMHLGENDRACELLETSLDYAMRTGSLNLAASVRKQLVEAAVAVNDFEKARQMGEALLQAGREGAHWLTIACGLEALADIAEKRQDIDSARDYLEQAMAVYPAITTRYHSNALRALGRIASFQKDFDAARGYLDKSLAICQEMDYQAHEGWTYHELASVANRQGDAEEAITWQKKALRLFESLAEIGSISICLGSLARFSGTHPVRAAFLWNACERYALECENHSEKAEEALDSLKTILTEEALAAIGKRVASLSHSELIEQALNC